MKRILSLFLALALSAGLLAGCRRSPAASSGPAPTATPEPVIPYDYNPLTGEPKPEDLPDGQRPVAVMVNNVAAALPQTGIGQADVIYEMETEGGITRLMAVFSDYTKVSLVGPVRSARDQFIQFVLPMNAIFVHIGGSTYATDMLNYYRYQDIDGMYLGTSAFVFDEERYKTRAQEHCWYTNGQLIAQGIETVKVSTTGTLAPLFKFAAKGKEPQLPQPAGALAFRFSGYGDAAFRYNAESGSYLKEIYGAAQLDAATGAQLAFKNVFVLFAPVTHKPDTELTDFALVSGEGYYFTGGQYTPVTWEKAGDQAPLKLYGPSGSELLVAAGKSYIAVVSTQQQGTLSVDGALVAPPPEAASAAQPAPSGPAAPPAQDAAAPSAPAQSAPAPSGAPAAGG